MKAPWVLGLAIGISSCVTAQRTARTTVGADGVAGATEDRSFDCDGETTAIRRHRALGGGVRVEHQTKTPLRVGGRAHAAAGTLVSNETFGSSAEVVDPNRSPYALVSTGTWVAGDFEHGSIEAGLAIDGAIAPHAYGVTGHRVWALPWLRLTAGTREARGELFAGPADPFTLWLVAGGVRLHIEQGVLRMGVGWGGRWVAWQDADQDDLIGVAMAREVGDLMGYLEFEVPLPRGWAFFGSLSGGSQPPLGHLGVRYSFDGAVPDEPRGPR